MFLATYGGTLVFKEKPSEDQITDLQNVFEEANVLEPKYDPENRWSVEVSGSGRYPEVRLNEVLNKMTSSITSGTIVFFGDRSDCLERCFWNLKFEKGKWEEHEGTIVYSKDEALTEFPPVSENDRAEFIGEIVDIFEDFLEEKGITIPNPEKDETDDENTAIIFGSDYGYCQDRLEEMMRNWKILKGE